MHKKFTIFPSCTQEVEICALRMFHCPRLNIHLSLQGSGAAGSLLILWGVAKLSHLKPSFTDTWILNEFIIHLRRKVGNVCH